MIIDNVLTYLYIKSTNHILDILTKLKKLKSIIYNFYCIQNIFLKMLDVFIQIIKHLLI